MGYPQRQPRGANTIEGIKLNIGSINYLGCLMKRARFQISNPSGVVWAMGNEVKYTQLGTFEKISPRAQVARRAKLPRPVF